MGSGWQGVAAAAAAQLVAALQGKELGRGCSSSRRAHLGLPGEGLPMPQTLGLGGVGGRWQGRCRQVQAGQRRSATS